MLKRILVGLGGTEYGTSAINQAIALATAHGAELTGVSVLDVRRLVSVGPIPVGASPRATAAAEERLVKAEELVEWSVKEFTEACRASGIRHQVIREVGESFTTMIEQARYHDLMVFGLRSLFEFNLVPEPHDTLVQLVQAGVHPILAVSRGFLPINKVLIAYSGSMESARTMKHFAQLRLWPDCQIRVVSFEDGGRNATQLVADAAEYCRTHDMRVEIDCVLGSPKEQLLSYATNWGADLTVIGNSAKSLLLRRVFGETALNAIRHAERPLFLSQ